MITVRLIRWWLSLFNLRTVFVWCVGATIATVGSAVYYYNQPPGSILSISEDSSVSRARDGKFRLIVHVNRERFCVADTERWLLRYVSVDGKTIPVYRPIGSIPGPPIKLGESVYGIELDIPPDWDEPGVYYVSRTSPHCGFGASFLNPPPEQTPLIPLN